jgi:hypothetical protein
MNGSLARPTGRLMLIESERIKRDRCNMSGASVWPSFPQNVGSHEKIEIFHG